MRVIGDPKELYDNLRKEYFTLFKRTDLTSPEKSRLYYLQNKMEELEAVYFGNPKGLKICSTCKKRIVREYHVNGIFLENTCPYCFKRNVSEIEIPITSTIGNRRGARS